MHTTYYIENSNGEILNYFTKLKNAKDYLILCGKNGYRWFEYISYKDLRIVQIKGSNKYEGFDQYYLTFDGVKFRKTKLR